MCLAVTSILQRNTNQSYQTHALTTRTSPLPGKCIPFRKTWHICLNPMKMFFWGGKKKRECGEIQSVLPNYTPFIWVFSTHWYWTDCVRTNISITPWHCYWLSLTPAKDKLPFFFFFFKMHHISVGEAHSLTNVSAGGETLWCPPPFSTYPHNPIGKQC